MDIVNGISQIYSTEALRQLMSAFEARSTLSQQVHELLESYLAQKVRRRDQNRKTLLEMASLMKKIQPFNDIIERFVSPLVNNPEEECRSDLSRAIGESLDITAKTLSRLISLLN
jgi:hypothetical protein